MAVREIVDLFTDDVELRFLNGVFRGRAGAERMYGYAGDGVRGPREGLLFEHLLMQDVIHGSADGATARGAGLDLSARLPHLGPPLVARAHVGGDGAARPFENGAHHFPDVRMKIMASFADRDFTIFHIHTIRHEGGPGMSIVDIFRMEEGRAKEHWEVVQEIPATLPHDNGIF